MPHVKPVIDLWALFSHELLHLGMPVRSYVRDGYILICQGLQTSLQSFQLHGVRVGDFVALKNDQYSCCTVYPMNRKPVVWLSDQKGNTLFTSLHAKTIQTHCVASAVCVQCMYLPFCVYMYITIHSDISM